MKPFLIFALAILLSPISALAAETSEVVVTTSQGSSAIFSPFGSAPIGSLAVADLGNDGTAEILVGASDGSDPIVVVFRQDGSKIGEFLAYAEDFRGGVHVAACDVDGDGAAEIVTGARFGGGPHVRIFTNLGTPKYGGFFAYASDFRGGVHIACGDVDNDGLGDIVTGAGPTGGPHLKVFSPNGTLKSEVFNGSASQNTGSYVSVVDGTIYAAPVGSTDDTVVGYRITDGELLQVNAQTTSRAAFFSTVESDDGTQVSAQLDSELIGNMAAQYILVDISEQRLTAYSYGIPVNSFLVSTGLYGYDTPYGTFSVLARVPIVDYIGADYSYPNTPWNLRFKPHYYIHTAYWHNNFGRRQSHGCVNMRESEAKWMYDWAAVGTPVEIVP